MPRRPGPLRFLCLLTFTLLAVVTPGAATAANFVVDTADDVVDVNPGDGACATADGACSLRAAIQESNALAGSDDITLPDLAFSFSFGTDEDACLDGDLDVTSDITITGAPTTIGPTWERLFDVISGSLTVKDLVIQASSMGNGDDAAGAAFRNKGTLSVTDCEVTGHGRHGSGILSSSGHATFVGSTLTGSSNIEFATAGISSSGTLELTDCVVSSPAWTAISLAGTATITRTTVTGGIASEAELTIVDSEISGEGFGVFGALVNRGTVSIERSALRGSFDNGPFPIVGGGALTNRASATATVRASSLDGEATNGAGGIYNAGTIELVNSSVSGRTNGGAGGILNDGGTATLRNLSITHSLNDSGVGGVENLSGQVILSNTIIAGNLRSSYPPGGADEPSDCGGTLTSEGYNLIGTLDGCTVAGDLTGNLTGAGTSGVDQGNPAAVGSVPNACPVDDFAGVPRPQGPRCDIGHLEAVVCGDATVAPDEECDDGNTADGDCCSSTCALEADGSVCDDGDVCTGTDVCDAGVCQGAAVDCGACATCDATAGCMANVRTTCRQPTQRFSGKLQISRTRTPALTWQWSQGSATTLADFGNPLGDDPYDFCVFDESGATPAILMSARTRSGQCGPKPCWKAANASSLKYADREASPDGIASLLLKKGSDGKAAIQLSAKGANLALPAMPLPLPLRVQLQAANGQCWESRYFEAGTAWNTNARFKAKAFVP